MAQTFPLEGEEAFARLRGAVCAIGVFDGVHEGHRFVIGSAAEEAARRGVPSAVVTFDVDPDEVFAAGSLRKLQSNGERLAMLATLPVDFVATVPFDEGFARLEPGDFLEDFLGAMAPSAVYVGSDFRFGRRARGDVGMLAGWGRSHGVDVVPVGLLEADGEPVKSTRIRRLLGEGRLEEANALLGRPYAFCGTVRAGRGEGTGMGFATANLDVPAERRILADGVYGGYAVVDGERLKAAISVGIPPTFQAESKDNLEVHVLGFDGDLYGRGMCVEFVRRLRPMKKFDDVEDLVEAVNGDIAWIRENL